MGKPKLISKVDAKKLQKENEEMDDRYLMNVMIKLLSKKNSLIFTSNEVKDAIFKSLGIQFTRDVCLDVKNDYLILYKFKESKNLARRLENFISRLASTGLVKKLPKNRSNIQYKFETHPKMSEIDDILVKLKDPDEQSNKRKDIPRPEQRKTKRARIEEQPLTPPSPPTSYTRTPQVGRIFPSLFSCSVSSNQSSFRVTPRGTVRTPTLPGPRGLFPDMPSLFESERRILQQIVLQQSKQLGVHEEESELHLSHRLE